MNYLDLTIEEMHKALVEKKTTPLALAKEAIARAKANKDNAFEMILEESALKYAATLTIPENENPLWGIPFVLKDNFSTKGIETTGGSNILKGYVPLFDATVFTRLKEAKCVLIGKTTLDELAMGGTGTTGHKGPTFNPFDPSHTRLVGGSSSGSAAACAAGIVPFALGSDTGDSVRKPASLAGLVGFKPSWGRISRYGLFPFAPSLDHVGFFTRSVRDSAYLTKVLSGFDKEDATTSTRVVEDYAAKINDSIKGKKIAVIRQVTDSLKDVDVIKAFNLTLEGLKKSGAIVSIVDMDRTLLEAIYPTYITISCSEVTSNNANLDGIKFGPSYWAPTYQELMQKARTNGFSELIKRRFIIGSFALMRENQEVLFLRAQKARRKIVDAINKILIEHDVIYLPAAPGVAPLFSEKSDKLSEQYLIADNHLAIGNFAGLPSLTVPIGFKSKLPFGGSLTGRAFEEATVLQVGQNIEKITGYYNLSALGEKI